MKGNATAVSAALPGDGFQDCLKKIVELGSWEKQEAATLTGIRTTKARHDADFFPGAWSDTFRAGFVVFVSHRINSANEATTCRSKRLATVIILEISSASDRQGMSAANMLPYFSIFKTYLNKLFATRIEKYIGRRKERQCSFSFSGSSL